jgi:hypothetical protein
MPIPSSNGWVEAAEQLPAFSAYFLRALSINHIQLDEFYAVLSVVRDGERSEAEAIEQLSRSPHWVWTAMDPETKLLLSVQEGERTLAMAQAMRHPIVQLLAPGWMPLPGLLYAQVVKTMRRRRIVEVKRHVVIGTQAAVDQVLADFHPQQIGGRLPSWLLLYSKPGRCQSLLPSIFCIDARQHG